MGQMKRRAAADEAAYEEARSFLVEIGTIEECENHEGTFFDGDGDLERAYTIANARMTKGTLSFGDSDARREATDLLKAVYEDNSGNDACPVCEKNFGPD